MPVAKHGITWNVFEFSRGYPRAPTVFDYLDLSGGRDSAIFYMDESLYQLAKPEPYTDYQMCGPLRAECNPDRLVGYVRDYFKKATSGSGYGHAIPSLPHLLVVHLPAPGRVGEAQGWKSAAYKDALKAVDKAMGTVLDLYRELGLIKRTTIFATSLSAFGETQFSSGEVGSEQAAAVPVVPWIASGRAGQNLYKSFCQLNVLLQRRDLCIFHVIIRAPYSLIPLSPDLQIDHVVIPYHNLKLLPSLANINIISINLGGIGRGHDFHHPVLEFNILCQCPIVRPGVGFHKRLESLLPYLYGINLI